MRAGEFEAGAHVLLAKIDMASPNVNMRDPTLYRIRTLPITEREIRGTFTLCTILPTASRILFEGVTHSLCTLEFQDHRPLYDWVLDELGTAHHPQQIEFARLKFELYRYEQTHVARVGRYAGCVRPGMIRGMPTIQGLRRRGYTPESIRRFCDAIGVCQAE